MLLLETLVWNQLHGIHGVELSGMDVRPKLQRLSVHSRLGSLLTTSDAGDTLSPRRPVRYMEYSAFSYVIVDCRKETVVTCVNSLCVITLGISLAILMGRLSTVTASKNCLRKHTLFTVTGLYIVLVKCWLTNWWHMFTAGAFDCHILPLQLLVICIMLICPKVVPVALFYIVYLHSLICLSFYSWCFYNIIECRTIYGIDGVCQLLSMGHIGSGNKD